MTSSNKIFFFALFISTIPTTALYSQKDEPQKLSKRTHKSNTLIRSKSIREKINKVVSPEEKSAPTRLRSNSLGNQLERSQSFKKPNPSIKSQHKNLLDIFSAADRFSELEDYMKTQPGLLHKFIGKLKPESKKLFITNKEGVNLLHLAAQYDQLTIAYVLIKKGIDINSTTLAGKTALTIARENRNIANNDEAKTKHAEFIEFIEMNNVPFTY